MIRPRFALAFTSALLAATFLVACGPNSGSSGGNASVASAAEVQSTGATAPAPAEPARVGATPQTSAPQPPPRASRSGFLVALDPGHGGDESGAAAYGVVERDSNLELAQRVRAYLVAAGVQVHLTREDNGRATGLITPGGKHASPRAATCRSASSRQTGWAPTSSSRSTRTAPATRTCAASRSTTRAVVRSRTITTASRRSCWMVR